MPRKNSTQPAAKSPRAAKKNGKRAPRFTARSADKHDLYQRSVQDPEAEIFFMQRVFKALKKRSPLTLREDFCGTALLCAAWAKRSSAHRALGIDLEPSVLAWGTEHNLAPLGADASRVKLLQQDVRARSPGRHDIVCAFNFSYWVFKTRSELCKYFASVRRGLAPDGLFMLDAYGGWESHEPMLEPRKIAGGFTYVWDQDKFDPISHAVLNHIHFEFADGTRLDKAFSYDWRFWTLPELRELLLEAGYADVRVYWDTSDDDDRENYRPLARTENQPGWLAYLVAIP